MKRLVFLIAAVFAVTTAFSQFSASLEVASYLQALNESQTPEFEPIELNPSKGINLSYDFSKEENSSFSAFLFYGASEIEDEKIQINEEYVTIGDTDWRVKTGNYSTESLGTETVASVSITKIGFENLSFSGGSSFYGGYGAFLSWVKFEDYYDDEVKGYGAFGKIGFGEKTNSFFIEAAIELSTVGSEFFSVSDDELRLPMHNVFIAVGYRF